MLRGPRLGLAVAFLLLAGCTSSTSNYKYRVAVIPKGLTHEFWQSIHRGAERAAADLKEQRGVAVEIIWDGPNKESDAEEQIKIINRQLAAKVSGLVLAPQHSKTMVAPVERAVQQGVPVVIIDSGLENQDIIVKYVATNNYNGGWLAAEQLLKVLREQGKTEPKLVLFSYSPGSESTDQREQGFEGFIAKQEMDGKVKVTWLSKDKYAGPTVDSAQKEASPLLNQLRDQGLDGIFAPNESSASGMLAALRSLKLNKQVRFVGFDSSPPLLDALREGDIDGLVLQDPYRMGYLGVWTLVHHLEGYDVNADQKKQLPTGETVITRETVDAASTRALFDKDEQAKRKMNAPEFPKK
jgi:ribose transport system substrate-binding protein